MWGKQKSKTKNHPSANFISSPEFSEFAHCFAKEMDMQNETL